MWTYTGLAALFFVTLAVALEFATASRAMEPVDVTEDLEIATRNALGKESLGRPLAIPETVKDIRAVRLDNGQYLVCGRAISELPDQLTGFSIQFERIKNQDLFHQRTYIDRNAHELCDRGRIPLLSLGTAKD